MVERFDHQINAEAACIELRGLRARGRHGVFEQERIEGQEFVVDVCVFPVPNVFVTATHTDDINLAIDYSMIADRAIAHITGEPVNLIETLAQRIAEDLADSERIWHLCVTVHKPQAPLLIDFDDVSVTVHQEGRRL